MTKKKYRVLWIVNMVMPDLAEHLGIQAGFSGTWMIDLSHRLIGSGECELAIAAIYGDRMEKYEVNGITYYTIPGTSKNMLLYTKAYEPTWKKICADFRPDLVHLHGTEYSHGLSFLRSCGEVPALLTIQGVMCKICKAELDGLSWREILNSVMLREWLHLKGTVFLNLLRRRNLRYETEIIKRVRYATGRTEWDRGILEALNPDIEYHQIFYNLRDEFYSSPKWNREGAEPYTIYASTSAQDPLKGGHIVLKALALVRRKYPKVKARFLLRNSVDGCFVINNGYGALLQKLIDRHGLHDNIECIPPQRTEGVIAHMLRSHCVVIPSAMENASATLREAMHLGVPCIAAYRGGMAELVDEGVDGFLYDYTEHEVLADKICKLFGNAELAASISAAAIRKAEGWHDRKKNPEELYQLYIRILHASSNNK